MSYKCPICMRTFSRRTAYSQHFQICVKKAEIEEDDDVEMNEQVINYENDDQVINYENDDQVINYGDDNIEVIMLFYRVLKPKRIVLIV
jgi:hypothetical protein